MEERDVTLTRVSEERGTVDPLDGTPYDIWLIALRDPAPSRLSETLRVRFGVRRRAHLGSKGTPIAPYDLLIVGPARARELTLVPTARANCGDYLV